MTLNHYHELALNWSIESQADRRYHIITAVVVVVMFSLGLLLSSINLPPVERKARVEIPPRIANFLLEKKKTQPKVVKPKPKPKPKPPKPKPKPETKPVVKKTPPKQADAKPLTKAQKDAREKAKDSGILALSNELSDLMDTSDISSMVGASVKDKGAGNSVAADNGKKARELLLADAGKGSGGVDNTQMVTVSGSAKLTQREISQVKQSLINKENTQVASSKKSAAKKGASKSTGSQLARAEEEITLVFDQNKSVLYSLYNRARRKNPGLKGKIIFRLTIAASGKVTDLVIVSSAINDKNLETKLMRRIRAIDFGAKGVKPITVTYPIEFLPS
jgi:periplasmic protein TonB